MNIGIDIEEVSRFKKYVKNPSGLKRIFSAEEISYSLPKKEPAQHLAARFAAKESVWKAFGGILDKKILITDISIKNTESGKPEVYIKNKKYNKISVSLSHTKKYVAAVAVIK